MFILLRSKKRSLFFFLAILRESFTPSDVELSPPPLAANQGP